MERRTYYGQWGRGAVLLLILGCGGGPPEQQELVGEARLGISGIRQGTPVQHPDALENKYPIVLVPGFFGWGRDELFGWKHFGGFDDIQQDLREHGYEAYTVAPGPVSSNWDRAAEMYAQLLGGRVDYGVAHAAQHGHARFGRSYEGLLPLLGQRDAQGAMRKVNIIAHSMGAQTARVLTALLGRGSAAERDACPAGICPATQAGDVVPISPLFDGTAGQWVHAVGSLSGAHNGSTVAHVLENDLELNEFISSIVKVLNFVGADGLYDFKLDQFGLTGRMAGESLLDYADRIIHSMLDNGNGDTAFFDLSLDGAARINGWTPAEPNVFYFTWTNSTSHRGWFSGRHYPVGKTNLLLRPFVRMMGRYEFAEPNKPVADDSWWPNDGIVNTISMNGPKLNAHDDIVPCDGCDPVPGTWNVVADLAHWDHWDTLGLMDGSRSGREIFSLYRGVAATVRGE